MGTVNTQTPLEQLDFVLNYLAKDEYAQQPLEGIKIQIDLTNKHNYEFDAGDFDRIINKLVDEKYVTKRTIEKVPPLLRETEPKSYTYLYQISFDGKLFNQSGGYKQMIADAAEYKSNEEKQKERMENNAVRLVVWTRVLAFVTLGAVLILISWELVEHYCLGWDNT